MSSINPTNLNESFSEPAQNNQVFPANTNNRNYEKIDVLDVALLSGILATSFVPYQNYAEYSHRRSGVESKCQKVADKYIDRFFLRGCM
jgi:hypothetical protein